VVVVEVNGYEIGPKARLTKADFAGADLRGANLTGADFSRERANKDTIWPEDFDPKGAGAWVNWD